MVRTHFCKFSFYYKEKYLSRYVLEKKVSLSSATMSHKISIYLPSFINQNWLSLKSDLDNNDLCLAVLQLKKGTNCSKQLVPLSYQR